MSALNIDVSIVKNLDPNDLLKYFLDNVLKLLDIHAPIITRKITGNSNCWITKELKLKCKERDILYKRAKRTKNSDLLRLYKMKRKELKLELNQARNPYLQNELSNISIGQTVWSKFKCLGLIKGKAISPLNYFTAETLNYHFATIVRKYPPCDAMFLYTLQMQFSSKVNCSFDWKYFDIIDVTEALKFTVLKSKGKSPGGLNLGWLRDDISQISIFLTFDRLNQVFFQKIGKEFSSFR
ncbi:GSCOCG00012454001-RA-CDS [Cotesia congregata]|nr:GSCOCG00012454001-RA-CDS [Cotesia congregata]